MPPQVSFHISLFIHLRQLIVGQFSLSFFMCFCDLSYFLFHNFNSDSYNKLSLIWISIGPVHNFWFGCSLWWLYIYIHKFDLFGGQNLLFFPSSYPQWPRISQSATLTMCIEITWGYSSQSIFLASLPQSLGPGSQICMLTSKLGEP